MKRLLLILPMVGASLGANLLENSSFEGGQHNGWVPHGGTWEPPAWVVQTDQHSGLNSMLMDLDLSITRNLFYSIPYDLEQNTQYTLSCWVKGSVSTAITLHYENTRTSPGDEGTSSTLSVTTGWTQVSYTFTTADDPASTYIFQVQATITSAGNSIWLDDFQLETGASPTAYAPKVDVEIGEARTQLGNVWTTAENVTVPMVLYNHTGVTANVTMRWVLYDFNKNLLLAGSRAVAVLATSDKAETITLDSIDGNTGAYRLLVWIEDYDDSPREVNISVVPVAQGLSGTDGQFGSHIVSFPHYLALAEKIGITWNRTLSVNASILRWELAEPTDDAFVYQDAMVANNATYNISVLGVLGPHINRTPAFALSGGWPIIAEWEEYTTAMVARYKGTVKHWEIYNEPNGDFDAPDEDKYRELVETGEDAIKLEDAAGLAVGMVTAYTSYMTTIFSTMTDNPDVVSYHWYPDFANAGDISGMDSLLDTESITERWNTESGAKGDTNKKSILWEDIHTATSGDSTLWFRDHRFTAAEWVRVFCQTTTLATDSKYFFYDGRGSSSPIEPVNFSFYEMDGTIQPRAVAMAVAAKFIDGFDHEGVKTIGTGIEGYGFTKAGNSVVVLWSDGNTAVAAPNYQDLPETLKKITISGDVLVYDMMGTAQDTSGDIPVTNTPLYLVGAGKTTAQIISQVTVAALTDTEAPRVEWITFPTTSSVAGSFRLRWWGEDNLDPLTKGPAAVPGVQFRTRVHGLDSDWTAWDTESFRIVSSIPEGWTIELEAKDVAGNTSSYKYRHPWTRGAPTLSTSTLTIGP